MTVFRYTAVDAEGREVSDQIMALSSKEAVSKLRGRGLFPTKVRSEEHGRKVPTAAAVAASRHRRIRGRVKTRQITQFARQLSTLQNAGLAILRSLRVLEKQQKSGALKQVIGAVADDIEGGSTFSEALKKHPKVFSRLFVNMVAAGETGGVLDVILTRIADFMERSVRLKSKIKGAMVYPAVVMIAAFLIVMGLMRFVFPMFADFLTQIGEGIQLPAITVFLMRISEWLMAHHGLNTVFVMACPFLVLLGFRLAGRIRSGRYAFDWLKMHLPVIGSVAYKTSVARWTRTFATLIHAGVPILDVLRITAETADSEIYARMLVGAERAIRQGDTFARPLERSGTVDPMVVNMIQVGEETGDLDAMLIKVADTFEEEADVLIGSLTSILEPVMILLLGGLVGVIVLAIFLPILQILTELLSR
jgi:type IV pilus assembly protein PilC